MIARALYNEIDRYACAWLSNLMDAGEITPGKIDDRPIQELSPDDVRGYERVHFFAGIGGWDIALDLAGWGDRSVWTGSCPCQPFSAAGKGKAGDDERHLWPAWASLIRECRPGTVLGEQVEAAIGWGWLDLVFADLEAEGYACGAAVLPACGVGAPHIRNRVWFVADANGVDAFHKRQGEAPSTDEGAEPRGAELRSAGHCAARGVADAERGATERRGHDVAGPPGDVEGEARERQRLRADAGPSGVLGGLADAVRPGWAEGRPWAGDGSAAGSGIAGGFWSDAEWVPCSDGKARPAQSRFQPLAHGVQRRPSKLRAYGNAIVPQVAAEFVAAFAEVRPQ
jgi:DNA (cytosine-5)-methyltransferase 1